MLKTAFLAASFLTVSACSTVGDAYKAAPTVKAPTADIVDTAVAAGSFNTLVAAVKAADLVSTLKGDGPFTVFAPTDDAFAALPEGTVETLLKPENKAQLQAILTYHVIPGKVMAADIAGKSMSVDTVNGKAINVDATNGVMINDATVTAADVAASNGLSIERTPIMSMQCRVSCGSPIC